MTKREARALLLILIAKRVPFRLRRESNAYKVNFATEEHDNIIEAMGA